jgi:hypothetical protein
MVRDLLCFATARQSRERASAQRESTEADRIEVEIERAITAIGGAEKYAGKCI